MEEISEVISKINLTTIKKFPLSGRDLLAIGADKKYIGLYLDVLKKEWFENGCSLSKEDLISKYESIFKYSV